MNKKFKIYDNKAKKPLILLGSVMIFVIVVFVIQSSLANPMDDYLKNQVVDDLSFENASLTVDDGITTFTAEVFNESGDVYSLKNILVTLTDSEQKQYTLVGYIGESLKKDGTKILKVSIDQELSNLIDLTYEIQR